MKKNIKFFCNPWEIIRILGAKGYLKWLPDDLFLRMMFHAKMGVKLNLDNPKTFNEKVQWLKLYDRNPLYTSLVDKYMVRSYVEEKIGGKYLIPLLGVWDDPNKIDFNALPDKFVLKCNHDSGTVVICRDKTKLDIEATRDLLYTKLKRNFFWGGREWPYKNVQPKVICEQFMENSESGGLIDYKIYCFDGVPKMLMVATDRFTGGQTHFDYFDDDYNWLDLEWDNPRSDTPPPKPTQFDEMMEIAKKLSIGIPQVRIDLYEIKNVVYFGEMTFFDGSGLQKITPASWDYTLGSWIKLPQKEK